MVNPILESKARIKRLGGMARPRYRMRVDDYRVFYSVDETARAVAVVAVVRKADADAWIARMQEELQDATEDDA